MMHGPINIRYTFHMLAVRCQVFPVLLLLSLRYKLSPHHPVIQQVSTWCSFSELITGGVTFESQSRHRTHSHRSLTLFFRPSKHMPVHFNTTRQFPTNSLFVIPPFYSTTLAATDTQVHKTKTSSAPVLHTTKLYYSRKRRHQNSSIQNVKKKAHWGNRGIKFTQRGS